MKKILLAAIVAVALFGGWFYASPLWTLRQMREAAQTRDAGKMSAYVDYPALREDVKGDFRRIMLKKLEQQPDGAMKGIGSAFAMALIGPMVDAMVSPEGVEAMFRKQQAADAQAAAAGKPKPSLAAAGPGEDPVIERVSLDEFRVRPNEGAEGAMVFRRSGLGWKLAGVDLPER